MKIRLLFLSLVSTYAFAKVPSTGFYLDVGAGASSINYFSNTTSALIRFDGGFNLNKIVGFQLGIQNYFGANVNNNNGTFNVNGWGTDFSVIPNIPIGTNAPVNIFFRLGAGYDSFSSNFANRSAFIDVLGSGVRYDVSSHLSLTAQWMGRGLLTTPTSANYSSNSFLFNIGFYF